MLNRALSHLIQDHFAYWLLAGIRKRAERRGILKQPFAVPMDDLIGQRLIATGSFELTQIDAVDQLLTDANLLIGFKPDFRGAFVDVGANIGVYATRYASAFTNILAIEPNPAAYHILQANIALSRRSNVIPLLVGCSDQVGTAQLDVAVKGMLGWSRLASSAKKSEVDWDAYAIGVRLDTLDNLIAREVNERVALLKIDVEGHEPQVLRGAAKTLTEHRPVVLYEALSNNSATESAKLLRAAGYDYFVAFFRPFTLGGTVRGLSVTARRIEPSAVKAESLICAFHQTAKTHTARRHDSQVVVMRGGHAVSA